MIVEADVHENYYSGNDSGNNNSDNEASDEDPQMDKEVMNAPEEDVPFIPSILLFRAHKHQ